MGQGTGSSAAGGVSSSVAGGSRSIAGGSSTASGGSSTGVPAGSPCSQASDCQSGTCAGGLCMPTVELPNTTCKTGPDCASGVCSSGTCVVPAGASGTVDKTDCAAGSLGCSCQPMNKCKAGLTCAGGMCCNSKTGSCDPGSAQIGAGGSGGGATATACKPGVVGPVITDCGYPFASSNPLTDILFNESDVLAAIVPSGGYPFASIQLFYNDEHAMTLGVREAVINGASTPFPVSTLTKSPDIANAPQTGTNLIIGQLAGVDPVGRPMWPALFVTDITHDVNSVAGDWQWGGAPVNPTYVAGTWKGAVRTVDASGASITPDADPAKNNQNYGNGHTAPAGALSKAEAYGTEVRWDIRLEVGHNYRFQVMVHDGDQNKIGGDAGEACVTFCAGDTCPADVQACTGNDDCNAGSICTSGCCMPPPPDGGGGSGGSSGTCPPDWKTYVISEGSSICTPPPTNGGCPEGYVITIVNDQQYCTPVVVVR
ncbi:MAG TPA: hypothetical protein VFK05_06365 [Polyangiaceae bacterium]|nr:hypothetical protein [Polyangiaceae bacterium]